MKPHSKAAFAEILRNLARINSQALARRAELAACLARLCPYRRQRLLTIEQSARDQLRVTQASTVGMYWQRFNKRRDTTSARWFIRWWFTRQTARQTLNEIAGEKRVPVL